MMIFPPLLLVFSTDSAVLRPCSCFPRPWPSLKPYFCMILWATVPLRNKNKRKNYSRFINRYKLYVANFHYRYFNDKNTYLAFLTSKYLTTKANLSGFGCKKTKKQQNKINEFILTINREWIPYIYKNITLALRLCNLLKAKLDTCFVRVPPTPYWPGMS